MRIVYPVLVLSMLNIVCIEFSNSSDIYGSNGQKSVDICANNCSFYPSYNGEWYQLICTRKNVKLSIGYCMTVDENEALFVTKCPYFQLEGHNVSDPGYIKLPDNVSELNDYMCGPMNRKGFLCEECVDGFAVSFTSMEHKCVNCTDTWYGIPLYLLIELTPITVFYLIILIFQVHITSAPMTCFIFYCQLVQYLLINDRYPPVEKIASQLETYNVILSKINIFFYGLWNLDFLRYITPPFCVNKSFKLIHTMLLGYVSVLYPLCLIALTWVGIKLHDENFRPIVWLWRPFHSCLVKVRRGYNSRNDVIDVFSAFFLLSYSKLMFQTSFFLACVCIRNISDDNYYLVMEYDPSIRCSGSKYYRMAIPALLSLCIFNILPALLIVFYPIKVFRMCLFKCKLDSLSLTAFTEKFYSCYRDGLDGGRDMRSFAGFYFLLRYLPFFYYGFQLHNTFLTLWTYCVLIFLSSALLIALVKPYKSTYMNVLDSLLLGLLAYACAVLSENISHFDDIVTQLFIVFLLPSFAFGLILLSVVLLKLYRWVSKVVKAKLVGYRIFNYSFSEPDDQLQPLLIDN